MHNSNPCRNVLQWFSYLIQFNVSCMQQLNNFIYVPLSATIIRFQNDLGSAMNGASFMFFPHVIFYDAMLVGHVILWIHQRLYFGHKIFYRKSPTVFIFWSTHIFHAAFLQLTFWNVFSLGNKRRIGVRAMRINAMSQYRRGSRWLYGDSNKLKRLFNLEFAHVDTSSGSSIHTIEHDYLFTSV